MSNPPTDEIEQYIHDNEPVSKSKIRERFGRNGLKDFASLLEVDVVFEGKDGDYWHVSGEIPHRTTSDITNPGE